MTKPPRATRQQAHAQRSGPTIPPIKRATPEPKTPTKQPPPEPKTPTKQPAPEPKTPVNKTRVGGGFNPSVNPSVNISIIKPGGGRTGAPTSGSGTRGVPGSDFMSNEDIQKFSEYVRKEARTRSVERSMDAEQLEAVLRNIPTADGSMAGARMRARRVARHLKRIAKAEQVIAKAATSVYSQFQREFEAELNELSPARPARRPFTW